MAQINEKDQMQHQLQQLEEQKKSLSDHIHSQDAQDEAAMYELDEVVKEIEALRQRMKDHGFVDGGRRKRHRRTRRIRRGKKSRHAKKSRRSKHY